MSRYTNLSPTKSHTTSLLHLPSLQTNRKRKETLNSILQRIDFKVGQKDQKYSSCIPQCLFSLKIRNQVLIINILMIAIVAMLFITFQYMYTDIIMNIISDSSNKILQKQNFNFQARSLVKYMDLSLLLFFNNNQALLATNQIYNYALQTDFTIDMGVECPISNTDEIYPSYYYIDMFCYNPQGVSDYLTYQNTSLNTDFVKFNSILNMFILCYQFVNNTLGGIQINLNNSDQMVSTYPQSVGSPGYSSLERPWYQFQEQCYELNISQTYYISRYMKWFEYADLPSTFGEFQTLSLLKDSQFHGVIQTQVDFAQLSQYFSNYNDVNIALLDQDGTILFEQTQINLSMLNRSQTYIYNQSKSGFNYLDWILLTEIANTTQSISMNNTQFSQPIQLNIAKFQDLPFYFTLFNNLTYEMESQSIHRAIFKQLDDIYYISFLSSHFIVAIILAICSFLIINMLKPISRIQKLISGKLQQLHDNSHLTYSNNILDILAIIITLKYSELSNLMFKKDRQCLLIEDYKYSSQKQKKLKRVSLNFNRLQNRSPTFNMWVLDQQYSFALLSIQSEMDEESSQSRLQNIGDLSFK